MATKVHVLHTSVRKFSADCRLQSRRSCVPVLLEVGDAFVIVDEMTILRGHQARRLHPTEIGRGARIGRIKRVEPQRTSYILLCTRTQKTGPFGIAQTAGV